MLPSASFAFSVERNVPAPVCPGMAHGVTNPEQSTFVRRALLIVLIAALALLLYALRDVLLLVFGAILIAVGMRGLSSAIERMTPLGSGVSLAAAGLLLLAVAAGLVWLLGSQISAQTTQLAEALPAAWDQVETRLRESRVGAALLNEIENARQGDGRSGSSLAAAAARIGGFTMSAAGALLDAFLVVIAAIFFAVTPNIYRNGAVALFPRSKANDIRDALDACAAALQKWLLGTLVSMTFLAVTITLGLWALGVPAPLALGLLAGLAQFVPLIGPILAAVPAVLIAFVAGPETALWTAVLYFVASQVEANLVYPLVQQRAVSLPPALTLFAVIALGLLLGPLGAVFATPIVVVATVFVVIFYVRGVLGNDARVPGQN